MKTSGCKLDINIQKKIPAERKKNLNSLQLRGKEDTDIINTVREKKMFHIKGKAKKHSSKWAEFVETSYIDRAGNEKNWSYIQRRKDIQAVVVIPLVPETGDLILIRQFRIPLEKYAIEFPAGLIDEGENAETAALRELLEETGFSAAIAEIYGPLCTSAGLTSETVFLARAECNSKKISDQSLDDSEHIEVIRVPLNELKQLLHKFSAAGDIIDSRVAAFALSGECG